MRKYQTLSYSNQFSFVCPIFNTETKLSACMQLRDELWRGNEKTVRRGCQACMRSGKCPAAIISQQIIFSNERAPDTYAANTPVVGKLHADVLARILPVYVREPHINYFGLSDAEQNLILTANDRIAAQLKVAPQAEENSPYRQSYSESKPEKRTRRQKVAVEAKPKIEIDDAAASGNLAAGLNNS